MARAVNDIVEILIVIVEDLATAVGWVGTDAGAETQIRPRECSLTLPPLANTFFV